MQFETDPLQAYNLAQARRLLSPKFGIVRGVTVAEQAANLVPLTQFGTRESNFKWLGGLSCAGSGATFLADKTPAYMSAIGELIERYCGSLVQRPRLEQRRSYADLKSQKKAVMEFGDLDLYLDEQYASPSFKSRRFTPDSKIHWCRALGLRGHNEVWVPARLAFFNSSVDPFFGGSTTSGLACGMSADQASLGALLEVIERDAIMSAWWTRTSFPQIDPGTLTNPSLKEQIAIVTQFCDRCSIIDLTNDLDIPTYLVILRAQNKRGRPALSFGASSNLNSERAISKALLEATLLFNHGTLNLRRLLDGTFSPDYNESITGFDDIMRFYARDANSPLIEHLDATSDVRSIRSRPKCPSDDLGFQLDIVTAKLDRAGYQALEVDLTTQDIRESGFHVRRSVVPGLIPINNYHVFRPLKMRRLYTFRKALGLTDRDLIPEELNIHPHPFP